MGDFVGEYQDVGPPRAVTGIQCSLEQRAAHLVCSFRELQPEVAALRSENECLRLLATPGSSQQCDHVSFPRGDRKFQ